MKLKRSKGFTLVEIMIVVAIIGILLGIAIPSFMRARERSRMRACQENLQKIDAAKEQWALENNQPNGTDPGATVPAAWIGPDGYIKATPNCPSGGTYDPEPLGTDPLCSYGSTNPDYPHLLYP